MFRIENIKIKFRNFLLTIFTVRLSILLLMALILGGCFDENRFISICAIVVGIMCICRIFFAPFINKKSTQG